MAKLIVRLHGKDIGEYRLEEGQEYIAGRDSHCNIVLGKEKGVSREHLKFYQSEGAWIVELVSRFGALILDGDAAQAIELQDGVNFSVPPYVFVFSEKEHANALTSLDDAKSSESNKNHAVEGFGQNFPAVQGPDNSEQFNGNMDATAFVKVQLVAYLKISRKGRAEEILKLEGRQWVAGREESCEIFIDDPHVSRRHFELTHTDEGYYITDLGSANGTAINNELLPAQTPAAIYSGDNISIMDLKIRFEIHDTIFDKKLENVPQPNMSLPAHLAPMGGQFPQAYDPMSQFQFPVPSTGDGPAVQKVTSDEQALTWADFKNFSKLRPKDYKRLTKKQKIRGALAISVLILLMSLMGGNEEQKSNNDVASSGSVSFDKLSVEQKSVVKDSFTLARNHFMQGKYELCSAEIRKMHDILPFFENSKELETLCAQATDLQRIQQEKERRERQKDQIEQQVRLMADGCKAKITNESTLSDVKSCLAPAIELDPQNSMIVDVLNIIEVREEERRQKQAAYAEKQGLIQRGIGKYMVAKRFYENGELRQAIDKYQSFLNANLPDPNGYKSKAKRELASAKTELDGKVSKLLKACNEDHKAGKYKKAIKACEGAINEDPKNEEALNLKNKIRSELIRDMKLLYEDSVLEESLGNIEAAKDKWKRIVEEDVSTGEHYQKAVRQLKKYGVPIP